MINFRFHIVSLTAVLLALGIGLVLGTTFLDQATVDVLRDRQDDLEQDIGRANQRVEDQAAVIEADEQVDEAFNEQIGERLFAGRLRDDPVLVVSTRGVDQDQVDRVMQAVTDADGRLLGTWWLTDRLRLDDDDEVADLGEALQLRTGDADRLRTSLAGQLGDVLSGSADASGEPDGGGTGLLGTAVDGAEPPVMARLVEGGFVEYQMPDGSALDAVALPTTGLRTIFVSGPEASVPPGEVVVPWLIDFSASGPVPAVAVEPAIVVDQENAEATPESLVVDIRGDDDLNDRISTVDDLERPSGLAATVLAAADADPAGPRIGHYGTGAGARLLPEPPGTGE